MMGVLFTAAIALVACAASQVFGQSPPAIGAADFSWQPPEKWVQLVPQQSSDQFTILLAFMDPKHPTSRMTVGKTSGEYGKLYDLVDVAANHPGVVMHTGTAKIDGRKAIVIEMLSKTDRSVDNRSICIVPGNNQEYYFLQVMAPAEEFPIALKAFRHSIESVQIAGLGAQQAAPEAPQDAAANVEARGPIVSPRVTAEDQSATTPAAKADNRTTFKTVGGSIFVQAADREWIEHRTTGTMVSSSFIETDRSSKYVQLYDPDRNLSTRLYSNRGVWYSPDTQKWVPWPGSDGKWCQTTDEALAADVPVLEGPDDGR